MSRRGENIYKRKDGRWEGRYIKEKIGNKSIYGYVYAPSYQLVKEKMNSQRIHTNNDDNFKTIDFTALSGKWLLYRQNNTKESTFLRYSAILSNHILPYFGNMTTSNITTGDLQTYAAYLLEKGNTNNGKGLSEKTVSDILCVIKSILRYGEKLNIRHNCILSAVSVKIEKKEIRVLSNEEYKKLTAYFLSENNYISTGMLLALFTGIRIGEICALTYDDIDLDHRKIHISKTMQRVKCTDGNGTYILIDTPKSRSSIRYIPLPDLIYDIIYSHNYKSGEYILTGSSRYIEPRTLQYRFAGIMEKLRIEGATFHTMRHSFATRCIEVGFDVKSLSEILGHSNVDITLNRYVHSSFELKVQNMKKLDVFFNYLPSEIKSDNEKNADI